MRRIFSLFVFLTIFFQTLAVYADGFIIIRRPRHPRPMVRHYFPLSVKYHRVNVSIQEQVSVTKIDQVFYNPNHRQLEGTYIFPLPERATLKQFSMYMNGAEVQGELLDSTKARQIYLSIVRRMQDPGLLEYVGRGMFRARVFPIPARGETRIKLSYSELLPSESDLVEYVYPLNTEKFSSAPLNEVAITVDIKSDRSIQTIYSPTHKIDIVRRGKGEAKVGFERKNVKPDKDFKLYFSRSSKEINLDLLTARPSHRDKGYFLVVLSPNHDLKKENIQPKDIVFVVDTSGSMMGDKMKQAKKALSYCIQSLEKFDRFAIVDFSTEARGMSETLLDGSEANKKEALQYIEAMMARGGTNIHEALLKAFGMASKKESGRPFLVCFLTDGEPTVGIIEPKEILKEVAKANTTKGRLFVLGIGNELNARLLDKLAEDNSGSRTYISEQENIEVKVSSFFNKIAYPALSNVKIAWSKNIRITEVYPKKVPDLFVGTQLKLLGRYDGEGSAAITLSGFRKGKEISLVFESRVVKSGGNSEVPALWANRKIGYLLDQIRLHGEKKELKDEIVRLAKKFGIVTPYTSYLVTEDVRNQPPRPVGGVRRRFSMKKADAFGAGYSPRGAAKEEADRAVAKNAMKQSSGKGAIEGSKMISKLKKAQSMEEMSQHSGKAPIKRMEAKTFYLIDNIWVDSDYDEALKLTKVKVKSFSEEYFKLLDKDPLLGKFLSLGQKVIVIHNGTIYMVE